MKCNLFQPTMDPWRVTPAVWGDERFLITKIHAVGLSALLATDVDKS